MAPRPRAAHKQPGAASGRANAPRGAPPLPPLGGSPRPPQPAAARAEDEVSPLAAPIRHRPLGVGFVPCGRLRGERPVHTLLGPLHRQRAPAVQLSSPPPRHRSRLPSYATPKRRALASHSSVASLPTAGGACDDVAHRVCVDRLLRRAEGVGTRRAREAVRQEVTAAPFWYLLVLSLLMIFYNAQRAVGLSSGLSVPQ